MPELHELTAAEMARQIRGREISAVDVAEALLARTDSLESLQAWVYIDRETVLADAEQRQRELDSLPNLGPLHGVPVGVKDIFYTAGIPTTACSRVYSDFVPEFDASVLTSLKEAGAIMMGKTVTTEFACLDPSPTLNPWNPAHTPGGSSSGSAVSVATGMCPVALGSQTVGSVLRPASYNGVVGLKPTYGRVSRHGVVPVSWSLDTMGWMSRSVEDAALMLQVMAGPDANDPVCARFPAPDYLSGLERSAPPRISLVTSFFMEESDEETQRHTRAMLQRLAEAGATVDEVRLPDSFSTAIEDQQIIMRSEAASFHRPMYETRSEEYQPLLRRLLARGLETSAVEYSAALERRLRFITDMQVLAESADVLLTPTTPTPSLADLSNTGNTQFQGPWTSCGLPTITFPSGLAESGLPMGLQIIAAPFREERLLAAARWCERVLDVHLAPPV